MSSKSESSSRKTSSSIDDERAQPATILDDWDSLDDSGNPLNWPRWKKTYHTIIPAAAAIVCTIASSVYTPAVDAVAAEFSISNEVALLPFAVYILGLGFGPLIAAPLSEEFGRRSVYLISLPIFALFTLGCGFSPNIACLIILRFFAGIFGGPSLVIGSATISDLYKPADRALPMTLYVATPFCGPAVAPLIGGYATQDLGWRWTMWTTLMIAAVVLLITSAMQETCKTKILQARARKRGMTAAKRVNFHALVTGTLIRPIHMAWTEPIVTLTMLYIAINFATLYSFFAAFPEVLHQAYGFDLGTIGLTFLAISVGALAACLAILAVDRFVFKAEAKRTGKVTPEHRLYLAMAASIMLPVGLFWFGWTARSDIHWICPIIAEAVFSCGNMLAFMSFVLYLSDTYGARYTASAMTANTFLRYLLGATFPLWINYVYAAIGTGWATSVLAFLSLLMSPVPWIFATYGPRLRERSGYR